MEEAIAEETDLVEELLCEGCAGFWIRGYDDVGGMGSVRGETGGWWEMALGGSEKVKDFILSCLYVSGGEFERRWRLRWLGRRRIHILFDETSIYAG